MEALMGPQPVHPLRKIACQFCGKPARAKDMDAHLETFHHWEGDRNPSDFQDGGQSEVEAYKLAHD